VTRIVPAFAVFALALALALGLTPQREAQAATLVFQADMYGRNVVPPVDSVIAYGFVRFFFNDARTEADYTVDVKGLSNTLVTGAAIHAGYPGTTGPMVRHLADGGFIVTGGRMRFTQAEIQAMAAGEWYVQVTSVQYPEGAMRGQIVLPPAFFATIPSQAPGALLPPAPPPVVLPPLVTQGPPQYNTVPVLPVTQNETGFTVYEDCIVGRTVRLRLQWATLNLGPQFVDLSLANNGFEEGTYVGSQPLAPATTSLVWDGLLPGLWHYLRVNTLTPDGWQASTTITFITRDDCSR
jgi:hypothetical protein